MCSIIFEPPTNGSMYVLIFSFLIVSLIILLISFETLALLPTYLIFIHQKGRYLLRLQRLYSFLIYFSTYYFSFCYNFSPIEECFYPLLTTNSFACYTEIFSIQFNTKPLSVIFFCH